ncbi:origin recognition complex subunit 1 [Verticillium alfalfae VaMs.102]|uniref:Origin recognition complex subunit 1 n=1 Tax=Verticillium alfalfae (strain VaMs.102 / ATCC MYA-4576 / FGSC 10136) TaxID=526221 RepID=C9SJV7_VERA1|nr:origin recognition complex subunit 1 [Verticillium alfalfae VaMs.102]EEY18975.1 origin recognition complex subunit 1 [Verticillium alfalfae VaMs.102]
MATMKSRNSLSRRQLTGVPRDDSDDELGTDDIPWEWIYEEPANSHSEDITSSHKKKVRDTTSAGRKIIGAQLEGFRCLVGECVLLKAEGLKEAWVAIICSFLDREDGEKAAEFMWFSTDKEIITKKKKRNDYLPHELYITPSWDVNPLTAINGKATVLSFDMFQRRYPLGRAPRNSKVFMCRRGCNTRTAIFTEEFCWEDIFCGTEDDIHGLVQYLQANTKSTRRQRPGRDESSKEYNVAVDDSSGSEQERAQKKRRKDPPTPHSKKTTATTPTSSRRFKVKRTLQFTPLATRRLSPTQLKSSPFQLARSRLHVASVPTSLPCREHEFSSVYSHLEAAIIDGSGSCIYIAGTPGTGKTATVREVIGRLESCVRSDELDDFIFVEINGMKITDPHQSYSLLWEALKSERVSPVQALDLLEQRTLSNKISSRLGLTRITFPGYNHEQLMKIIQSRLQGIPGDLVEPDAIQFASRKVAAVSGDARRALDICRRAVELAEAEAQPVPTTPSHGSHRHGNEDIKTTQRGGRVTIATIRRAINEATTNPIQQYLRSLALGPRLLLFALVARTQKSGTSDATFGDIMDEVQRVLSLASVSLLPATLQALQGSMPMGSGGVRPSRYTVVAEQMCLQTGAIDLAGAGIIILESQRAERPCKLRLAVGDEEIKMAFRDDAELRAMGVGL